MYKYHSIGFRDCVASFLQLQTETRCNVFQRNIIFYCIYLQLKEAAQPLTQVLQYLYYFYDTYQEYLFQQFIKAFKLLIILFKKIPCIIWRFQDIYNIYKCGFSDILAWLPFSKNCILLQSLTWDMRPIPKLFHIFSCNRHTLSHTN